ncbi:Chemotaxis response regulator protein-glutamate methylesterase [bacterium YEK0313]|nr:Chemotaxis response regulator protein-glutamate methylesterase [bacterium YEK0313]
MSFASTTGAPAAGAAAQAEPIKVMLVDDAVVVRGLVGRWISDEPDMTLVAAHRSAREAVADITRQAPDVVVLDIEMPDMDGLTALPLMIAAKRDLVVVMASTLTRRSAEISLKCLSLGAADYVPKPESNAGVTTSPAFRRELIDKIRALGRRHRLPARMGVRHDRGRRPRRRRRASLRPRSCLTPMRRTCSRRGPSRPCCPRCW